MIPEQLREALDSIRQIQRTVMDRQRFRGFSGRARVAAGIFALVMAFIMQIAFPHTTRSHLLGWGVVLVVALLLNGGAVLYWFLFDPRVRRDIRRLRPLMDTIPPLLVGGALTAALILRAQHDCLFGVWMCMFGLSNLASRYVLPGATAWVGVFYVVCGMVWWFLPDGGFLNPLPAGLVFCAGEVASGLILHFDERRYLLLERREAAVVAADEGE